MRISEMTWGMVEAYLEHDDRCVVPLGSTEQHAFISLATDSILAERVSVEAAEPLGVPVFPAVSYGVAPYFMGYPGTVTISEGTYQGLLRDIVTSLRAHGFRRVLIVSGHGGNSVARPELETWARATDGLDLRWHDWWSAPGVRSAIEEIDPAASHASWMETFPWTRLEGVELPREHKPSVDLSGRAELGPAGLRQRVGDGSFGGWYERDEKTMQQLWAIGVEETRARLTEDGWS